MLKENKSLLVYSTVALVSIVYISVYKKTREQKEHKKIPYPPHVINWPIFGHIFALGKEASKQITEWHKESGPIYKINVGNQVWIVIGDPYLAHDIFVKSGSTTSSRAYHRYLVEIYARHNKGIGFIPYDDQWRNKRKVVTSILGPLSVDGFSKIIEAEAEALMNRLDAISQSGECIDPFDELKLTSMNIILRICLGTRFKSVQDSGFLAIDRFLKKTQVFGGVAGDLSTFLPMLSWINFFTGIEKRLQDFVRTERDLIFESLVKEALEREKHSLVKDLYRTKKNGLIDEDDIIVILSDLIIAGTDTVAITLYWGFAILSQYPDVQEKLIKELDVWKSKNPAGAIPNFHKDRDHLPYSICVQKEVMRFHPATNFGLPHMATEDTKVNGYFIPKGAALLSSMSAMHMDPTVYKDPHKFKPERFWEKTGRMGLVTNTKIEERDHFGFGWGRRICPGIHLSEIQIFNFYVHYFSRFKIEPELDKQGVPIHVDLKDYVEEGITAKPKPCKYRIVARSL